MTQQQATTDPYSDERRTLADALATVRRMVPAAAAVRLETSDQQPRYGFVLIDVVMADGVALSAVDADLLDDVWDTISPALHELSWDGAVGEDAHGYATVAIDGPAL
jgi:hypothetical protein